MNNVNTLTSASKQEENRISWGMLKRLVLAVVPIQSPEEGARSMVQGYLHSAEKRRAKGDSIGADGDEACAKALAEYAQRSKGSSVDSSRPG